jgi:hypothetical protein
MIVQIDSDQYVGQDTPRAIQLWNNFLSGYETPYTILRTTFVAVGHIRLLVDIPAFEDEIPSEFLDYFEPYEEHQATPYNPEAIEEGEEEEEEEEEDDGDAEDEEDEDEDEEDEDEDEEDEDEDEEPDEEDDDEGSAIAAVGNLIG